MDSSYDRLVESSTISPVTLRSTGRVPYRRLVGDVTWLTSRQDRVWRLLAGVLALVPDQIEGQLQRDAGIGQFSYGVLVALSEAPGRVLRMSELARITRGSRSRLSHSVATLERQGWVRRERTDDDGRGNLAVLTDAGYAKIVAAAPGHVDVVRSLIFEALRDEQLDQLEAICAALLARIEEKFTLPSQPMSTRRAAQRAGRLRGSNAGR